MRMSYGVVVCCGLLVWCSAWAGPALVLEPPTFDWGRQTENKGQYPFTFTVKNGGDEELQITRVRPGCSCTKVELKKQKLAPGESTEMTGVLTTKGDEGPVHKGIILTSNDPNRQTTTVSLEVRFPINGVGLRLKGSTVYALLRSGALWAYMVVENCEPETAIAIQAMELPAGWDSPQTLPYVVKAEERVSVPLTHKLEGGAVVQAFDGLPITLVTDSAKTPRVQGTLTYRPETPATAVSAATGQQAAGSGASPVRWPMAKPAPLVAPITAPPVAPPAPALAPRAAPQAATGGAPAATAAPAAGTTPAP